MESGISRMEEEDEQQERDWEREERMKEKLLTTRGLLLHIPGSCRFNDSSNEEENDWNTYMKAKKCCSGRFHNELSYEVNDLITVLIDVEDMSSQCAWWHGELRGRKGIFSIKLVESYNQENYHSLCAFLEDHFQGEEMTSLRRLAVRQVENAPHPADLLWECVQCPQLTELDLKGCHLVLLWSELQFWAMPNLVVLNLSNTQLPYLPSSVGRLKHLTSLLLQGNTLTTLPTTLSFCSALETLDLRNNNFSILPAVIFHIRSLKVLRRHGNYDMRRVIADLAATTRREQFVMVVEEREPLFLSSAREQVVPLRLQAVRVVMSGRLDYWALADMAPALCRVLDKTQSEYKICYNCYSAKLLNVRGFRIRWLVESFLGLKHVPFEHFACSSACSQKLNESFQSIQDHMRRQYNSEYTAMLERYSIEKPMEKKGKGGVGRGGVGRREMEVTELWSTDFSRTRGQAERRRWTLSQGREGAGESRTQCVLM